MSAKKSFFILVIIILITSICSTSEAESVYAGREPSGHDDNPIAINNHFIPDQRLAGIPGTELSSCGAEPTAVHLTFQPGDLFVGVGNSQVNWYLPDGTLNKILTAGVSSSETTGMAFDPNGNLYVTLFHAETVCKFDNTGNYLGTFGSGYNGCPESIVRDAEGDFYVGTVDGDCDIKKFNAAGNLLAKYNVPIEDRGSDWIDLAPDQCTMYYTSEGKNILRYDVCADVALSNFNNSPLPGQYAFALRLLPTGGIIVANRTEITRLDASGDVIQSYDAPGEDHWFALNLDPDGTSFWSAGSWTGDINNVYKFDIESGEILLSFNTGTTCEVSGLIVFGTPISLISLTKVDDVNDGDCRGPGEEIVYTICYNYPDDEPNLPVITDVKIIDYLPEGVDYDYLISVVPYIIDPNYNVEDHTYTWDIGTVSPGDTNCVKLTVEIKPCVAPCTLIENESKIKSDENLYLCSWAYEDTPVCCPPGGCIIYVDTNAPGCHSSCYKGTSWRCPYTNLQDALRHAQGVVSPPGSCSSVEIRVAEGTYRPDEGIGIDPNDAFYLINNVAIYGGYAGYGAPDPNARDPELYKTILSGDVGRSGINTDNSYHVVTGSGKDETAVLDGFTITAGNANGAFPDDRGGGMYNWNGSPTVTNCMFTGNSTGDHGRGGGMYNENGSPTVTNCMFTGNSAADSGGGMYNENGSPMVTNCSFTGNVAAGYYGCGGGMYNNNSSPTVANCIFTGNIADEYGGGMCNYDGSPTVTNCMFTGNSVYNYGGGMYNSGGSLTVTNCMFTGNSVNYSGGGMYNYDGSLIVTNCLFTGNSAADSGGGMYNGSDSLMLTNCIFWDDYAVEGGNEIYNYNSIPVDSYDIKGGCWDPNDWDPKDWDRNLGRNEGGNIDADPCFVEPGYWGDINDPNIHVEPDDPDPNTNAIWVDGNYRLLSGSHCIDAGDSNSVPPDYADLDNDGNTAEPIPWDLDGHSRFVDDPDTVDTGVGTPPIVDMGAYERERGICGDADHPYLMIDINNDCEVNIIDTVIMALAWLSEDGGIGWNPACNLYEADSIIDFSDFAILGAHWLECTKPECD